MIGNVYFFLFIVSLLSNQLFFCVTFNQMFFQQLVSFLSYYSITIMFIRFIFRATLFNVKQQEQYVCFVLKHVYALQPSNYILKSSKIIVNGLVINKSLSTCRQFESRKTNVVLFFLQNSRQIISLEAFIKTYVC